MRRDWSDTARPPVEEPPRRPAAYVRFRSGHTATVVEPSPHELTKRWMRVVGDAPTGGDRLITITELWSHRADWPEIDMKVDLAAIESIQATTVPVKP